MDWPYSHFLTKQNQEFFALPERKISHTYWLPLNLKFLTIISQNEKNCFFYKNEFYRIMDTVLPWLNNQVLTIKIFPSQDKSFPIKDNTKSSHEVLCMKRFSILNKKLQSKIWKLIFSANGSYSTHFKYYEKK